jgi:hypothetical protein|tara:strand:+ start:277 stop:474 length:198 start_codon:yes stop_codon:yes gene_type:complete
MNRNVKSLVRHCSETLDSEEIDSLITQLGFVLQDRHEVEMEEALLHEYYLAMQAEDDEMMSQWEH